MSTRRHREQSARAAALRRLGLLDPAEAVALVSVSRRELLLATHRRRLPYEELEDCYSQATLELLVRARRSAEEGAPSPFASLAHVANALEQRLLSRIQDRHRAIGGRSPIEAAMAGALPLAACEDQCGQLADVRADVESIALARHDLRRIARCSRELSRDQRLVLASQLCDEPAAQFCRAHGWTLEKYRKVAQRARARLSRLLAGDSSVPLRARSSDQWSGTRL